MKPGESTSTTGISTISPRELSSRMSQGESIVLIDVRTALEYATVHAAGARHEPLDRLEPDSILKQTPAGTTIAVICKAGSRGAKACARLADVGARVLNVEGGTDAWIAAGLAVERQSRVMSLERQVRIAAGSMVVLGVSLGYFVHPGFFGLSAFVGAGLVFAGVTNWCGAALLLAKMPWNNRHARESCCAT